jgi:hypothetical protein
MTQFQIDAETYLIFPIFALGAAGTLGLVDANILPWFSLNEVILDFGNIEWTIGRLLALLSLGAVVVNRDEPFDFDGWGVIEMWTLYATLGLIIAPPFFPAFAETLAETPAAFLSFTVQSIGFALITYIN